MFRFLSVVVIIHFMAFAELSFAKPRYVSSDSPVYIPDQERFLLVKNSYARVVDASGRKLFELKAFKNGCKNVYFGEYIPEIDRYLTGAWGCALFFDPNGREVVRIEGNQPVYIPDQRRVLVSGGYFNTPMVYDLDGNLLFSLGDGVTRHYWHGYIPEMKQFVTIYDNKAHVFNEHGEKQFDMAMGRWRGRWVTYVPQTQHYITINYDDEPRVFDERGQFLFTLKMNLQGRAVADSVEYIPDTRQYLVTGSNGMVSLFDELGNRVFQKWFRYAVNASYIPELKQYLFHHSAPVFFNAKGEQIWEFEPTYSTSVTYLPDQELFLTSEFMYASLYDRRGNEQLRIPLDAHVAGVSYIPERKWIVVGSISVVKKANEVVLYRVFDLNGREQFQFQ